MPSPHRRSEGRDRLVQSRVCGSRAGSGAVLFAGQAAVGLRVALQTGSVVA
ncbi:hypothetical protein [Streptomyces noursei]|uniref:hypothetical protein n=1 Tax=Streptomyces noursei TaxID=1971 RepID=UPI0015E06AA1|nr:hypothetical protein [Streptomyces noursei]